MRTVEEHARYEREYLMKQTPIEQLKNGQLYRIWARNASLGVWNAAERGFYIARFKLFPPRFLFLENHYNADDVHGTALPLEELPEPIQDTADESAVLKFLNEMIEKYANAAP